MLPALLLAVPVAATLLATAFAAEQSVDIMKAQKQHKKAVKKAQKAQDFLVHALTRAKTMDEAEGPLYDLARSEWDEQANEIEPSVAFESVDFAGEKMLVTNAEETRIRSLLKRRDEDELILLLYRIKRDQGRRARHVNMGVAA